MPGRLPHSPARIVRQLLVDLGLATSPDASPLQDWPAYHSKEPNAPDRVITVFGTFGMKHGRTHVDGETQEHHGIQVRVRSDVEASGWDKVNEIAVAFDESVYQESVSVGGTNYLVHCINRDGDPIPLGQFAPNSKLTIHVLNCLLSVRRV